MPLLILVTFLGGVDGDAPIGLKSTVDTRCSVRAVPIWPQRSETYFLGTATPDTVAVTHRLVNVTLSGGHWGSGEPRDLYGQVIEVEAAFGEGAQRLSLEPTGSALVVAIPWDYAEDCSPTFWNRSARWSDPEQLGFYRATLRPEVLWEDGLPTFDVFRADVGLYPHGAYFRAGYRGTDALRTRPSLDARQMFSLTSVLPTHDADPGRATEIRERLQRWESTYPELATWYPADITLAEVRRRFGGHLSR